jgi:hypothetical protein
MRRHSLTRLSVVVAALALTALQVTRAQQVNPIETGEHQLTYSRGEGVIPDFQGWYPNPDGTVDLLFGYLNQNWSEEPDIPIGPDNNISTPYGPDAGQPTHFFPRQNHFIFKVRVQKDFPEKEVIWTLKVHGKTFRAYGTLHPAMVKDEMGIQREFFGFNPAEGNKAPELTIQGEATRTLKVGEAATLTVVATDDGVPRGGFGAPGGAGGGDGGAAGAPPVGPGGRRPVGPTPAQLLALRPSICGAQVLSAFFCGEPNENGGVISMVRGLRMACFLYRGDANGEVEGDLGQAQVVKFDPPQAKVWEDHRHGSPWAAGYVLPPIPPNNTWNIKTSFSQPGTYVVRCQAHDGLLITNRNVTFTVTR